MYSTALVTGAAGFIGSHLCARLAREGVEVHGVSREARGENGQVRWWQADLRDQAGTLALLRRVEPEIIFHLASKVTGSRAMDYVRPTLECNLFATVNILEAATTLRCRRVLIAGSLEEPDVSEPDAVCCSPYAASKWAASAYARMFHRLYGTPVAIARIFMAYGPGPQNEHRLVPYVIRSLLSGQPPKLTSGRREVDWIYVDDVVEGLLAMAKSPGIEGGVIELGSGTLVSVRELVEKIARLAGSRVEPVFGARQDRAFERVCAADLRGAQAKVGWRPAVTLDDGIARTVEWFRRELAARSGQNQYSMGGYAH